MFSDQNAEVLLNAPCKCIDAVKGDRTESRFLVGTCSNDAQSAENNSTNHLHVLRFHSELNEFGTDGVLDIPTGPISMLCTSPQNSTLVLTGNSDYGGSSADSLTTSAGGGMGMGMMSGSAATLWKLPPEIVDKSDELELYEKGYDNNDNTNIDVQGVMDNAFGSNSGSGGIGISQNSFDNAPTSSLEQITTLNHEARIVQIEWRDTSLLFGGSGGEFGMHNDNFGDDVDDYGNPTTRTSGSFESAGSSSNEIGNVITLDCEGHMTQWDVDADGEARPLRTLTTSFNETSSTSSQSTSSRFSLDPHNENIVAVSAANSVQVLDWRVGSIGNNNITVVKGCHRYGITDLDYNPNKPNVLCTGGKDGMIKFWDLRYTLSSSGIETISSSPTSLLMTGRGGHTHWITRVKYNPFHDQLICSTGTDSIVNLWRMSTISSSPLMLGDNNNNISSGRGVTNTTSNFEMNEPGMPSTGAAASGSTANAGTTTKHNELIKYYEHVDSIYDMCWSVADAWIYVSVGYDGKVVLNHVPSNEKYKILL